MLANRILGGGFRRNTRQNIAVRFQVVNRVQQLLLSTFQIREYLGALIEKIVQQFGGHDRIVGCMVAPIGDHNIRKHHFEEVVVQISSQFLPRVDFFENSGCPVQIQRCTYRRCTVGEVVAVDSFLGQSLEKQK